MIRAKLWFRCAAMHDPVTPVLVQPAVIGWDAKKRKVDLTIERAFKGDELVMRMKGWVTTDVKEVVDVVKKHGFLKVLDDRQQLLAEPGIAIAKETLSREVLGRRLTPFDRSLDTHVSNLRRKLGPRADGSPRIMARRGHGYLYVRPPVDEAPA